MLGESEGRKVILQWVVKIYLLTQTLFHGFYSTQYISSWNALTVFGFIN